MNSESLFTVVLGLSFPWQIFDIQFDPEKGRIDIKVIFTSGAKFSCPSCSEPGSRPNISCPKLNLVRFSWVG